MKKAHWTFNVRSNREKEYVWQLREKAILKDVKVRWIAVF